MSSLAGKFVLIDDDRLFGYALLEVARDEGIDIDYFESLEDLGFIGSLGRYQAVVVDYHLGGMTGVEIAAYLDALFGSIPMVLISSDAAAGQLLLPGCVNRFVDKSAGLGSILAALRSVAAKPRGTSVSRAAATMARHTTVPSVASAVKEACSECHLG